MSHEFDNEKPKRKARDLVAPAQTESRRRFRGNSDPADWTTASAEAVKRVVCAVTQHGFAVRFGYTRDGGAFAVGVVGDGDPYTEFIRPTEEIDLFLDALATDYAKAAGE
jgi:hypothetical protein